MTERRVDNMLGSVHRLQLGNSEELICLMQVYTQERFEKESHTVMTSWNKWHQDLWSKTIKESHFQGQTQTGRETHPWCCSKGKKQGQKAKVKTKSQEVIEIWHTLDHQRPLCTEGFVRHQARSRIGQVTKSVIFTTP